MKYLPGRRAYLSAGLKLAALVALPIALWRSAAAQGVQDLQLDTGESGSDLKALRAEVAVLKIQIERMMADRSTLKAPFTVVNDANVTIFSVSLDDAGQPRMQLGGAGGAQVAVGFTEGGGGMSFKDSGGTTRAQLTATPKGAQIVLDSDSTKVTVGPTTDGSKGGIFVERGGTPMAELSAGTSGGEFLTFDSTGTALATISNAENMPLTLYDSKGTACFSVGPESDGGSVRMTIGDPAGPRLQAGVTENNTGSYMSLLDQSGTERASVIASGDGIGFSLFDAAGAEVFSADLNGGTPNLRVGDAAGPRLQAGVPSGGAGSYLNLIGNGEAKRVALSASATGAPLTLFDTQATQIFAINVDDRYPEMLLGDTTAARLRAGVSATGDGAFLSLSDKSNVERVILSTLEGESAISVLNSEPLEYFGVKLNDDKPTMVLGNVTGASITAGETSSGDGMFLNINDAKTALRVAFMAQELEAPLVLLDPQSEPIFVVDYQQEAPTLTVGKPDAARLQTGPLADGSGSYWSLYDSGNTERGSVTAAEKSTQMQLNDTHMTADLGSDLKSDKAGLFLSGDELNYASIRFSKELGGSIRLGDKSGVQAVGIGAGDDKQGGNIGLSGPGGGSVIASLWGGPDGGILSLYEESSGSARVQLNASKTGDFNLYGEGGAFTASSGENTPTMQISDAGGTVLVEAYVTRAGLGAVAVGPAGNGVAGTIGMGMKAASALLGKK